MKLISHFNALLIISTCLSMFNFPCFAKENWRERAAVRDDVTSSDVSAEITFGRAIAARILGQYKGYNDSELTKYVNLVGLSLARNTNRPELEYHFMVLNTGDVNAYAAPGGYIFITKGALQLMKDESELAGVLSHEISHVTEKHVVKELNIKGDDDSVMTGLAELVGGKTESARAVFSQAVERGLDLIFKNDYKREDEMQADRTAVSICALDQYDPAGLARYLERISTIKGKLPEKSDDSHPTFATRIAQINGVIKRDGIEAMGLSTNESRFSAAVKNIK